MAVSILPIHHDAFEDDYTAIFKRASDELVLQSDHDSFEPEVQGLYDFFSCFLQPVLRHTHQMHVVLREQLSEHIGDIRVEFMDKWWVVDMVFVSRDCILERLVRFSCELSPGAVNLPHSQRMITRDEREFWQ